MLEHVRLKILLDNFHNLKRYLKLNFISVIDNLIDLNSLIGLIAFMVIIPKRTSGQRLLCQSALCW